MVTATADESGLWWELSMELSKASMLKGSLLESEMELVMELRS